MANNFSRHAFTVRPLLPAPASAQKPAPDVAGAAKRDKRKKRRRKRTGQKKGDPL